jgi:hypothetical protein
MAKKAATSSAPAASASKSSAPPARASASSAPPPRARAAQAAESGTSNGSATHVAEPSHEQIAQRAFELYLARGGYEGSEVGDWLRAESELRAPRA